LAFTIPNHASTVCDRTNAGAIGAKLAFYSEWAPCTTYPDATLPDPEFCNYSTNTAETGNDYYSNDSQTQSALAQHCR